LAERYSVNKFAHGEPMETQGKKEAALFLRNLIALVPYRIRTILTDNGQQFTNLKHQKYAFPHIFGRICDEHNVDHGLTKPAHPWTNGQVECMNKTIKEATVNRYYHDTHRQLRQHLQTFINAYNFAKRLKSINGLIPYEFILNSWKNNPDSFTINPLHYNMGLYNWGNLLYFEFFKNPLT
jgi:transposase InsO family protein